MFRVETDLDAVIDNLLLQFVKGLHSDCCDLLRRVKIVKRGFAED